MKWLKELFRSQTNESLELRRLQTWWRHHANMAKLCALSGNKIGMEEHKRLFNIYADQWEELAVSYEKRFLK